MSGRNGFTPAEQALTDFMEAMTQRWEEAETRLEQSLGAVKVRGARPVPVNALSTPNQTTQRISHANGSVVGYALRQPTNAGDAMVELRQHDQNGDLLLPVSITSGKVTTAWFSDSGISFADGLFLILTTGVIDGVIYLRGDDQ